MKKLVITVGAPAAGKSTLADRMTSPRTLNLERDRFRVALFGSLRRYWDMATVDEQLHKKMSQVIGASMTQAMHVSLCVGLHDTYILSDTGFGWGSVRAFHDLAKRWNMRIEVILLKVPLDVLLDRNANRDTEKKVPEHFIRDAFEKIEGLKPHHQWWLDQRLRHQLITVEDNL